jgi:hypothetical protein
VVVGELAGLSAEAEVCDGRDFEVLDLEALGPFVFGLVLEIELEGLVGEVGEASFGGNAGVTDSTSLFSMLVIGITQLSLQEHTEHPASSFALPSLSLS